MRVAETLMSEGTVGGIGEDRSFQVHFWPGLGTELLANKCYLLQGTVVLQESPGSEMPRVCSSAVYLDTLSSTNYMLQLQLTSCLRLSLENRHLPTSFIEMIAAINVSEDITPIDGSDLMSFTGVIYEYSTRARMEAEVRDVPFLLRYLCHGC